MDRHNALLASELVEIIIYSEVTLAMFQTQLVSLFISLFISAVCSQPAICSTAQNCTRTMLNTNVSNSPVQCLDNLCVCLGDCFLSYNGTGSSPDTCVLNAKCFEYSLTLGQCESTGRKRITAVALQIFLGGFGAANFYIGLFALGGVQLFLFILFFIFSICAKVLHRLFRKKIKDGSSEDETAKFFLALALLIVSLGTFIVSAIVSIWWIVDVIIFLTNSRVDLNGCFLT